MSRAFTTASLKGYLAKPAGKKLLTRHSLRRTFSFFKRSAERNPQAAIQLHEKGTLFKPLGELAIAGGTLVVHHAYARGADERKLRLFANELGGLLEVSVEHKRPKR